MSLSLGTYIRLFRSTPDAYLILANDEKFTIIEVNEAYLSATNTIRENIIGHPLFEIFPDDPALADPSGVHNLTNSLNTVIHEKKLHEMAVQHYNIPQPEGGSFEERYWAPRNLPVLDENGNIICIIHNVTDVTEQAKLIDQLKGEQPGALAAKEQLAKKVKQLESLTTLLIHREAEMTVLKKQNEELRKEQGGK